MKTPQSGPPIAQLKVSVLMPVFNGEKYVAQAIQSILTQTLQDFELVIIDDGSTDTTREIVASFDDEKIVIISNPRNLGLISSLNIGIAMCRGTYIARMDADDISKPERLEIQVAFLEENPQVDVVGSQMTAIDTAGRMLYPITRETNPVLIAFSAFFLCPLLHPTVMAKREVFTLNPYDIQYPHAEDYALWSHGLRRGRFHLANLDSSLVLYRMHAGSITATKREAQNESTAKIRRELLSEYLAPEECVTLLGANRVRTRMSFTLLRIYFLIAYRFVRRHPMSRVEAIQVFKRAMFEYLKNLWRLFSSRSKFVRMS